MGFQLRLFLRRQDVDGGRVQARAVEANDRVGQKAHLARIVRDELEHGQVVGDRLGGKARPPLLRVLQVLRDVLVDQGGRQALRGQIAHRRQEMVLHNGRIVGVCGGLDAALLSI